MTSRMNDDFSNQMCRIENVLDKNTIIYMTSQFTTVITLNKLLYIYSSSKSKFVLCTKSAPMAHLYIIRIFQCPFDQQYSKNLSRYSKRRSVRLI